MDNYIIRIYRHEKGSARKIVGTEEEVGLKGKKAFTHYDELWDILNPGAGKDVLVETKERRRGKRAVNR